MVLWINLNENNSSESIFCIERKNWPYPPTASGSYSRKGGREAGRRNMGGFQNFKTSLQVKLLGLLFCLMSLQFYCSFRTAFSRLMSS